MLTVIIIIVVVVAVIVIILIIITTTSAIIIIIIIIIVFSNRYYCYCYFYLCYHWNNNYFYSCHHTDMNSYQNSKFFACFCWFTFVLPPKKFFWGTKATQLFCVIPAIAPRIFFLISILHYSLVFDCKFIWKSYVNFSFTEFIFVMVKDTYFFITNTVALPQEVFW